MEGKIVLADTSVFIDYLRKKISYLRAVNSKPMLAVSGIYENGSLKLDEEYFSRKPVKVIITFLEDVQSKPENGYGYNEYSFSKSREVLENFKGSFSDAVIDERRKAL